MARARNIKPAFFKNELLAEAPFQARLLFIGLWTLADREGRMEDRPKRIRMEIFPADDVDTDAMLDILARLGFIIRYEIAGERYISITQFLKHQQPHIREAPSTIPAPTKDSARHNLGGCEAQPRSPESPILNPESPIPITTLSGQSAKTRALNDTAKRIIEFLNKKTGKAFTPAPVNIEMIAARLKEGATEQDCKSVIARKTREWEHDEKMAQYLRPATLFNRQKFAQYLGELVENPHV